MRMALADRGELGAGGTAQRDGVSQVLRCVTGVEDLLPNGIACYKPQQFGYRRC